MNNLTRSLVWSMLVIFTLAGCATTDYDLERRKAISDDFRRLGDAYIRQGDYTRALRYYLEAAKRYDGDPQLHYSLGLAYQEKQNYTRAIEHFQRALTLKPDMAPAQNSLGVAYIKAEEYDKAIAILQKMIDGQSYEIYMTPQYPKYNLGWAYYQSKRYQESEHYLQQALDYYDTGIPKDPIYVKALRAMGLNAMAQSQTEKALSFFLKALPMAPKWADLYLDMARAHRLAGDTTLAFKAYQKVIELAPSTSLADTAAEEAAGL